MKKILLALTALFAVATSASAQSVWKMVITHNDGTRDTIAASNVKNVTFASTTLEDRNADQVIIKELYVGGCPKDEGTGYFQMDKGFVLYNNCPQQAVVNNLAVGQVDPANAHANNGWYENDKLTYADQGWIPAIYGIWYFQEPLVIEPYSQIVVSCMGSIDNTKTYSQSVNYANPAYYAMYDPESGYNNTAYYPTPADVIPTSHYLKAVEYGQGNAWPLSVMCPAFVIFQTKGVSPAEFANNADNYTYMPGQKQDQVHRCVKIPNSWILDGIEVWQTSKVSASVKRLTDDVDAGHVNLTNRKGHSLYRNVDKAATLALPENEGKLVYGYALGVDGSTDPSGIDAEASIKNGAHIVYQDNNNSTQDFHERQKFSVRGE
ncbi:MULTISPECIES: DUF4876 domain-containing protein [Prevotellaceae]|uniref:DUF4876 domain-containing protein n=2 Tax=Prevotellaceae TaxID=171552 RepID=F9D4S6_PREDD|nr:MULTISPECIES: DUF4876 domain-containing protein [Prevotellaceae]AGB28976.1 hypothetical protein Prede_1674 [Prevotella dentalis DSM 3688]EGQ13586.1 hypothetical protein HMPREF9136_1854 [Prevotella dentalis DSM 3688]